MTKVSVALESRPNARTEHLIAQRLATMPGVVNVDPSGEPYEVKPGIFSSLYFNVKQCWADPALLDIIADDLAPFAVGSDAVIGVETGGSPFASLVASRLQIPLGLARKQPKGSMGLVAGYFGADIEEVALVDDVLATGGSMAVPLSELRAQGRRVRLVCVLSHGLDDLVASKYDIRVCSLLQPEHLIDALPPDKAALVVEHLARKRRFLENLLRAA